MHYNGKMLRHELKYYISYGDYIRLKILLSKFLATDSNVGIDGSYHIRSLYFDDIYDSALYEKDYGVFQRTKHRIRIYNYSQDVIKLERKKKYSEYISKEAISLTADEYKMIIAGDYSFLSHKEGIYQEFYRNFYQGLLKPKVIVDYIREPYVLESGDVRITFDMNLRVGLNLLDIFDENIPTVQIFDSSVMILEVKFNEFLPNYLREILASGAYGRAAISKYVLCRRLKDNIY